MRWLVAVLGLLAGCDRVFDLHHFDPPDGDVIDVPDDTMHCYGNSATGALLEVCITGAPPAQRDLGNSLDTGVMPNSCDMVINQGSGQQLCVIVQENIRIGSTVSTHGFRPVVLVATKQLLVDLNGAIDVSSRNGLGLGAGANDPLCPNSVPDGASLNTTSGGGPGGSLATSGGNGGNSGLGAVGGAATSATSLTAVRGGCKGGNGGGEMNNGGGGGGLYLIAGETIEIRGLLDASGQGGGHGEAAREGGGGGGSGGLLALDAPHVVVTSTARLVANGGGGGGGADIQTGFGTVGRESNLNGGDPFPAPGGLKSGAGGDGGDGQDRTSGMAAARGSNGVPLSSTGGGGGGGGGGLGFIRVYSPDAQIDGGAKITPALPPVGA